MADADLYDYELPPELIAQQALDRRDAARLLVVRRSDGTLAHRHIRDLPDLLEPGQWHVRNRFRADGRLVSCVPGLPCPETADPGTPG
ncbi:MAG: S-adenosylmethionine:tRNA ribosyltransferase-isomerase [Planctomycetia bacterium]|nr:S-adenosylmethionine:tRNA ribosyltransferase-isomerase [Planctomycetia bacterium]